MTKKKVKSEIRNCRYCKKEFKPLDNEKYCCKEHQKLYHQEKRKESIARKRAIIKVKICVCCHRPFETNEYSDKATCSDECKSIMRGLSNTPIKKVHESKIDEIERKARVNGGRYADWQRQQTLAMVGRIDTTIKEMHNATEEETTV